MDAPKAQHPADQTLRDYAVGKLDDPTAESVNTHLELCPPCRRRVGELTSDSFVGRLRHAQARPDSQAHLISSTAGLSVLNGGASSPQPPPASTLLPGLTERTDYDILRELGRGGMGVVYLPQNKLMGRLEVLKVVSSHLVNRSGVADRFLAEIRNAAKLHHTNVVTAYSAFRLDESLVLAMQYVEGLDLARLVAARGPLPVAQACNYVHQAAKGLQHAHDHGMVHRDIKPSNLMLARDGDRAVIKVLDFGLAKVRSESPTDGTLTHDGQMLGTPHFIAPEQISNARGADIRADIYSLGCTLYYLLTGGPPFQGASLYDLLQAHHSMDAKPLNLARPEVPVELAALVAKMMAKEPERRFQEPKDVAQALAPFFKKGNVALKSTGVELSQAGQTGSGRPGPGVVSTPTQPATNNTVGPNAQTKKALEPSAPGTGWKSLIDLGETERSRHESPAIGPKRRPRWVWPSLAVAVLLLGLLLTLGVVVLIKTANGTIELTNLSKDAEVFVDGEVVAVTWPGGGKILQVGTQSRSTAVVRDAVERVQGGAIGEVLVAKAWNSQLRRSIGKSKPAQPPAQLDYDLWVGAAPMVPYRPNLLPGSWRWWSDFGCGDLGNDGVHDIDVACWGLDVKTHPARTACLGGKSFFDDDQQFPDTQYVVFEYPDAVGPGRAKQLIIEQRIWSPYFQEGYENGAAFYGTKGMLVIGHSVGWTLYGPKNRKIAQRTGPADVAAHHQNFLDCIRDRKVPHADVMVGHRSVALVHLANIGARIGRVVHFDPQAETIVGDSEATAMLSRHYREGHWAAPKTS